MDPKRILYDIGAQRGHHVILHGSFKALRSLSPWITAELFFDALTEFVSAEGSVILPAFTYCLKRKDGQHETFHPVNSVPKTGLLSQRFLGYTGVIRTASPTHSFSIWGTCKRYFPEGNNPSSPLGDGSVLAWLDQIEQTYALLIGTDFRSLSFLHFLELFYRVPYTSCFCWDEQYLPVGVGVSGERKLDNVPGCSNGFNSIQRFLLSSGMIIEKQLAGIPVYYINLSELKKYCAGFMNTRSHELLCNNENCSCCNLRRKFL